MFCLPKGGNYTLEGIKDFFINENVFINLGQVFCIVQNDDEVENYSKLLSEFDFGYFKRYYEFAKNKKEFFLAVSMTYFRVADKRIIFYLFFRCNGELVRVTFMSPCCSKCKRVHDAIVVEQLGNAMMEDEYEKQFYEIWRNVPVVSCLYCGGKFDRVSPVWVTHLPNNEVRYYPKF